MDKKLMLNKLDAHLRKILGLSLHEYLGKTPQVLTNWKSRNTFDPELIYTKCEFLNPEWLLTGKEPMLKSDVITKIVERDTFEEKVNMIYKQNQEILEKLNEVILLDIIDKDKKEIGLYKKITTKGYL